MNHSPAAPIRRLFFVLLIASLAALACALPGGVGPAATRAPSATEPEPTSPLGKGPTVAPPEDTDEPEPTERPATRAPRATATPEAEAPFTLASEPYVHPSGAFAIVLPDGWEITEYDETVFVQAPDDTASIELGYTYVGTPLDSDGITSFIEAIEANFFATYTDYSADEPQSQSDGSIGVIKTLTVDGTPHTVFSYYWQDDLVMYESDFWVESDLYDSYINPLLEVANSMTTDPSAANTENPYGLTYTFTGPGELFEIAVPYAWTYSTESDDVSVVDTFVSPDGASYIENITYDEGQAISRSTAGAFALALLKQYYELNDIRVTDDRVQPDGSERLDWISASNDWVGMSFFETRGTTFLLLTWVVDTDAYDLYRPVWDSVIDSYTTPE